MQVVHITLTPLAGSPIRISDCLNKYTQVKSRVINLGSNDYGKRSFKEDLLWHEDKKEAIQVIKEADILHFHHYFDFASENNPFQFDFIENMKPNAKYLMHWHTNPTKLARNSNNSVNGLVNADIPQMVVAQFHESYYPNAYPVPLIVDTNLDVKHQQRKKPVIFFSPSNNRPAHLERWETKGRPETLKILKKLEKQNIADFVLVENMPFEECMDLRKSSDIVIDDLVTGSFHTVSLEGLSVGKPTVSYVDSRTQAVLAELTQTTDLPIVNVSLDSAYEVLKDLCQDLKLREELADFSKNWLDDYYNEEKMVLHYVNGYNQLLETGELTNVRYKKFGLAKHWLYTQVPDITWLAKKKVSFTMFFYTLSNMLYLKRFLSDIPVIGKWLRKVYQCLKRK